MHDLALAALAALALQDPRADATRPPAPPAASPAHAPAPGTVPADAAPEARAAFEALVLAVSGPLEARAPLTSFELEVELVRRDGAQRNESAGRHAWLSPGWVRSSLGTEGKREYLRGPRGDFLIEHLDGGRAETVALSGREYATDRELLDDLCRLSSDFALLSDPAQVVLTRLAQAPGLPPEVLERLPPAARAALAPELAWLELDSPSFGPSPGLAGVRSAGSATVVLGLSPQSRPRAALIRAAAPVAPVLPDAPEAPETSAGGSAPAPADVLFLLLDSELALQQELVPNRVRVWRGAASDAGLVFDPAPETELWVLAAKLRAPLRPEDFGP
jgi:hypothetical protein